MTLMPDCDDGSCKTKYGCTDPSACNYDSDANCDDGSCKYRDACGVCGGNGTKGCTDPGACNYNPDADCDDGSCKTKYGCTNPSACNYDPTANCDDGSCKTSCGDYCTYTIGYYGSHRCDLNKITLAECGKTLTVACQDEILPPGPARGTYCGIKSTNLVQQYIALKNSVLNGYIPGNLKLKDACITHSYWKHKTINDLLAKAEWYICSGQRVSKYIDLLTQVNECYNNCSAKCPNDNRRNSASDRNRSFTNSNDIQVYPNPVQNELFIDLKKYTGKQITLKMTNIMGQTLQTYQLTPSASNPIKLNVSNYTHGLYFLHIGVDKTILLSEKIIIGKMR